MKDEEFKSFKTKVLTLFSILSVLVFIIYIGFFIFLNLRPYKEEKPPDYEVITPNVEIVNVSKKEAPDAWSVRLMFEIEGEIIRGTVNIEDGEVVEVNNK